MFQMGTEAKAAVVFLASGHREGKGFSQVKTQNVATIRHKDYG